MITRRKPTEPGTILQDEFFGPLRMTREQFASRIGCEVEVVDRLIRGRAPVTEEMAWKLAAALRTTPDFWLNAQEAVDLHRAASGIQRRRNR